jgi:hypothetical protein
MLPTLTKVACKVHYDLKVPEGSWELQEMIKKYLGKVELEFQHDALDIEGTNKSHTLYSLIMDRELNGEQIADLLQNIPIWCKKIDAKEKKELAKQKVEVEKWLKDYKEPERHKDIVITKLHSVLLGYYTDIKEDFENKKYDMAHCHMCDFKDLTKIYLMVCNGEDHKKIREEVRSLDTIVREDIPTKVYEMICDA